MKSSLLLCIFLTVCQLTYSQDFITKWTFDEATSQIKFSALTTDTVHYTWTASPSGNSGNGSFIQTTPDQVSLNGLNVMSVDTLTLNMKPGNLSRFYFEIGQDNDNLMDVSQWGEVTWSSMESMFKACNNLSITALDTPNLSDVANMNELFRGADSFNQDISGWDVSSVTSMRAMFQATVFNQNISGWDVSNVRTMQLMFSQNSNFNQDIGGWDISNVRDISFMFSKADSFNQDISSWNIGNVRDMSRMFSDAASFNQDLGDWILDSEVIIDMRAMFNNSGIDCNHYSATLVGWQKNNPTVMDIILGADGLQYGTSAVAARDALINDQGWTINGDEPSGMDCDELVGTDFASTFNPDPLTIYPNPTSDQITIKGDQFELDGIRVTNVVGQDVTAQVVLQQQTLDHTTIDLSKLHSGVYFIRTSIGSGVVYKD